MQSHRVYLSMFQQGFTIVELMVSIMIVYLLVGLAYPSYKSYRDKARFQEAIASIRPLEIYLQTCVADRSCLSNTNGEPVATAGIFQWGGITGPDSSGLCSPTCTGLPINLVGSDLRNGDYNTFSVMINKLPLPQGNLINPQNIIQGNKTMVTLATPFNSISFVFLVSSADLSATVNSADSFILNADLYNVNNSPAVMFTIGGSCKTKPGGAIC